MWALDPFFQIYFLIISENPHLVVFIPRKGLHFLTDVGCYVGREGQADRGVPRDPAGHHRHAHLLRLLTSQVGHEQRPK
jgi:hypothetical protein